MSRTAALLCVHDDVPSLGWWIAHHVAVGFSTLLICDDHSTDGSWELLDQAAQHYDVRTIRTDQGIADKSQRYTDGLKKLLNREAQDIDWVLPLSIDEYFVPEGSSVEIFLFSVEQKFGKDIFETAQAIPVNWCICGLNGQEAPLSKENFLSPRSLYTRHAPESFPDHHIVRSFFRPQKADNTLPDPFAHLTSPIDWSLARILHDAAASSLSPTARHYYDRNENLVEHQEDILKKSTSVAATLLQTALLSHWRAHQKSPSQRFEGNSQPSPQLLQRFYIGSPQRSLIIDHKTFTLTWRENAHFNPHHETRLCLATLPSDSETSSAWLYAESAIPLLYLPIGQSTQPLNRLLDIIPVILTQIAEGASLTLLPGDEKFSYQDEVLFPLTPIAPSHPKDRSFHALSALTHYGLTANGVKSALQQRQWPVASALGAVSVQLPYEDAKQVLSPLLLSLLHPQTFANS
ncbi:hypothetical protein GS501_01000 [Saccharibacter sp. 17.LH.SD]|uniref:glycosyltransferase family 2 protein n=1 Tax=Saccharibacter sp. 17.LH.SD TaxID=2689393 RepID=UPI00136E7E44|nr:glycosyltransferase family 2 protein [Saccharibacter sp. 17.LH.SD]MXV43652.1 hypothetical protein [Saccharibacter sp. 17.LH.SD]